MDFKEQIPGRILVVDDDPEMCRFFMQLLGDEGYAVEVVHDGASALRRHRQGDFDLVITDLMMPRMRGTELVRQLREHDPDALVLLVTAFGSIESAVEAMRAGAFDYVTKPFRTDEILLDVNRALEQRRLRSELRRLRTEVQERYSFQNVLARSEAMQKALEIAARVSDLSANVLIIGESGTGKEMIARAIHRNSARAEGPFIPLNCAAVPETLLESELFGYTRGAFTDAKKDRRGLFQEAGGGVLFLDEISEMPLSIQAKLLRVIEDKEVRPLGSNQSEKIDARVISASNRDLEKLVQEGSFRRDLYYRLNVIRIELPPLRERPEDIPVLVDHFIRKFAGHATRPVTGIEPDALAALMSYRWPGNVRELEHTLERAVLLGKTPSICLDDLPESLTRCNRDRLPLNEALARGYTLKELEKEYIHRVLENTNGNKTEAARILGVDRTTLYRKLEEYKVEV
ncbi:MAG TPA: sigma-54 dependent transcriptional regulator [candidate division Zixibacteria bacterium]|nr:sigma-54 dependent transcriptional regulator [candidate division Zixibacteria bacterium]